MRRATDLRRLANARILVVEDERIVARDIELTLQRLGHSVCGVADNGEEAIRRAEEEKPDLVLMDVRLRGEMDGIEASARIRSAHGTPVVFLTAFADEATLERVQRVDPYGYVLKPFAEADLRIALTLALCKHRSFSELDTRVRERTEALLSTEVRYRRMAAVAELGMWALRSRQLEPVLERAVQAVADTLGTETAEIFEIAADGSRAVLREAVGWPAELEPTLSLPASAAPPLRDPSGEPGSLEQAELGVPPELRSRGIVSGIRVPLAGPNGARWGILGAHSRSARKFIQNDEAFLQAVGNIVSTALARVHAEEQRLAAERHAEEQRTRTAQAEESVRARDEFLSIASHELKTPLTSLRLELQSLVRRAADLPAAMDGKLRRALRSTERLASLVESLLDVSLLSTRTVVLNRESASLGAIVQSAVDHLRAEAELVGCPLRVDLADAPTGRWDRLRLEQVVVNLLSNAMKYGAGRPVEIRTRGTGTDAELVVSDHGAGVAEVDRERIFGRFERAVSHRNYGGLGLGLFITREVVRAHGGAIRVEGSPGAGATFVVTLPLREPPEAPMTPALLGEHR